MSTPTTTSTHLLRALLREASYLPDAYARRYFRRYIVSRFKAYQPKQNATSLTDVRAVEKYRDRSFERRPVSIINERTSRLQQEATKSLHFLQRANHGELACLEKVLHMTYGRVGRRKHNLLNDLLKPDAIMAGGELLSPSACDGRAPLQQHYHSDMRFLRHFDAPKNNLNNNVVIGISDQYSRLRSVIKSQYKAGISVRRELKSHSVKMPEHNIWMRPMPIKRARNLVLRWYKETMTRLLVPIPEEEFDHMQAIVNRQKHMDLRKRRTPGFCRRPTDDTSASLADEMVHLLRLNKPSKAARSSIINHTTHIDTSSMRRLYSRVLELCCKTSYDQERERWVTTWGKAYSEGRKNTYKMPIESSLFAGVDSSGHVVCNTKVKLESAPKSRFANKDG